MKSNVKSGHFVVEFPLTADELKKTKKGIYVPEGTSLTHSEKLSTGLAKNYRELLVAYVGEDCKSVEVGDTVYLKFDTLNHYNVPFEFKGKQYLTIPEYEVLFNPGKND